MTTVQIDSKALLKARASQVLALDHRVFASGVTLQKQERVAATEDQTAVVLISGPLAQKGFADLCGFVDGYDRVSARFAAALNEPAAGAVLLVIDSPGGDVAGLEEAVATMRKARDASGKRVIAYVDEFAASAAYWNASAVAHEIVAPTAALIGSIGCIGALVDETKALEKEGLKITLIREPEGKAEGNSLGPVTELAEERATALVKSAAERFYAAVAEARRLQAKDVKALNGAVLEAPAALKSGLIDHVGGVEVAKQRAAEAITERKEKMSDEQIAKAAKAYTGKDTPDAVSGAFARHEAAAKQAASLIAALGAAGILFDYDVETDTTALTDTKRLAAEKATLIKSLIENRQISKTQQAWAESQTLESLQSFAEGAPSHKTEHVPDAKGETPIDPELQTELARIGMSQEDFQKTQAAMKAQGHA